MQMSTVLATRRESRQAGSGNRAEALAREELYDQPGPERPEPERPEPASPVRPAARDKEQGDSLEQVLARYKARRPEDYWPTQDELPGEDGVPMETRQHFLQMTLLMGGLELYQAARGNCFVGGNNFVYYSPEQVRRRDYIGPDVFVVLDALPGRQRDSWVCWEEGKGPDVVMELLSEKTAKRDKTSKKAIYQNKLQAAEYIWYDPKRPEDLAGFVLKRGRYRRMQSNGRGELYSERLGLWLVRWEGRYQDWEGLWLRWADETGTVLPLPVEAEKQRAETAEQTLEAEKQRAEMERQRAEAAEQTLEAEKQRAEAAEQTLEAEKQRAERMAEMLRRLGMDPSSL